MIFDPVERAKVEAAIGALRLARDIILAAWALASTDAQYDEVIRQVEAALADLRFRRACRVEDAKDARVRDETATARALHERDQTPRYRGPREMP